LAFSSQISALNLASYLSVIQSRAKIAVDSLAGIVRLGFPKEGLVYSSFPLIFDLLKFNKAQ